MNILLVARRAKVVVSAVVARNKVLELVLGKTAVASSVIVLVLRLLQILLLLFLSDERWFWKRLVDVDEIDAWDAFSWDLLGNTAHNFTVDDVPLNHPVTTSTHGAAIDTWVAKVVVTVVAAIAVVVLRVNARIAVVAVNAVSWAVSRRRANLWLRVSLSNSFMSPLQALINQGCNPGSICNMKVVIR